MTPKLIIPFFLISAGLIAQTGAGTVDIQISTETVPQGGIAQITLFLSSPEAISDGELRLTFNGGIYPAQSPAVIGAIVFSAAGDVSAVAVPDTLSTPYGLRIAFYSPSAGVGRIPGLPIAEFSIPVTAPFSVGLDLNNSRLSGPTGNYALTVSPGGAAIGGTLSIQQVILSGAQLQINGMGFGNGTSIEIDGTAVSASTVSGQEMDVALAGPTELTGKHVHLRNPDGNQLEYWGGLSNSLYTFPLTASASGSCVLQGPQLDDPPRFILQNPNSAPAQVTITTVTSGQPTSSSATIAPGATLIASVYDPVNSTFRTSVETPLRAECFYTVQHNPDLDLLQWLSVTFQQPAPAVAWVANAASQIQGAVAPGEIISVYGSGIGPASPATLVPDSSGNVARQLGGVQISFDGTAAPLLYVSGTQVNAVMPYEIGGQSVTRMQLSLNNTPAKEWDLPVASSMPAIFTAYTSTQAAVLNQDNTVNGEVNPAARGSVIQIFATGEGETTPSGITAEVTGSDLKQPQLPVTVSIGGTTAQATYIGSAPEAIAGLFQVNAVVPQSITPGTAVPITIRVGTLVSPTASIAIK